MLTKCIINNHVFFNYLACSGGGKQVSSSLNPSPVDSSGTIKGSLDLCFYYGEGEFLQLAIINSVEAKKWEEENKRGKRRQMEEKREGQIGRNHICTRE